MKKRLIIFSVAIMAFLAMPLLRASAASKTIRGEMGGYGVYGAVNIYERYADANAGSDYQGASVTVDLTYEYLNDDTGRLESQSSTGYGSGGVVTSRSLPQGNYISFRAVATYVIWFGDYRWNPDKQTILYSSSQ